MKLVVVGKGGSGKTTTAAVLARGLARRGAAVVALDCDTNPNLGLSLGVGEEATERLVSMRQALDATSGGHAADWAGLIERFSTPGPDGVTLAVVNRIDRPDPGCPCCGLSAESMLAAADPGQHIVVADLEAGIGTLTRLGEATVDRTVVVAEATPRSVEVARRAARLAAERRLGPVTVVANRCRSDQDRAAVTAALAEVLGSAVEVWAVPEDPAVTAAEQAGRAVLDSDPDSPAVGALLALAERILGGEGQPATPVAERAGPR